MPIRSLLSCSARSPDDRRMRNTFTLKALRAQLSTPPCQNPETLPARSSLTKRARQTPPSPADTKPQARARAISTMPRRRPRGTRAGSSYDCERPPGPARGALVGSRRRAPRASERAGPRRWPWSTAGAGWRAAPRGRCEQHRALQHGVLLPLSHLRAEELVVGVGVRAALLVLVNRLEVELDLHEEAVARVRQTHVAEQVAEVGRGERPELVLAADELKLRLLPAVLRHVPVLQHAHELQHLPARLAHHLGPDDVRHARLREVPGEPVGVVVHSLFMHPHRVLQGANVQRAFVQTAGAHQLPCHDGEHLAHNVGYHINLVRAGEDLLPQCFGRDADALAGALLDQVREPSGHRADLRYGWLGIQVPVQLEEKAVRAQESVQFAVTGGVQRGIVLERGGDDARAAPRLLSHRRVERSGLGLEPVAHREALNLLTVGLLRKRLRVYSVVVLAELGEARQPREMLVPVKLRRDHPSLLLVAERLQAHDHEAVLVQLEAHALWPRCGHRAHTRGHQVVYKELLNAMLEAGGLVDPVQEQDKGAHLVRLQQHVALGTPVAKLPVDVVHQHAVTRLLAGGTGGSQCARLRLLYEHHHQLLHHHEKRNQGHALAVTWPCELLGQQLPQLQHAPRLARTRLRLYQHTLCLMGPLCSPRGRPQQKLRNGGHVGCAGPLGPLRRVPRRSFNEDQLVVDPKSPAGDCVFHKLPVD
eukprot:1189472-Prorocentrum_minimum.AAC.1